MMTFKELLNLNELNRKKGKVLRLRAQITTKNQIQIKIESIKTKTQIKINTWRVNKLTLNLKCVQVPS